MKITDQIKAKAEELDLQGKFEELSEKAKHGLAEAKSKAGTVAHDSKERVEGLLDKAGDAIDGKTDGKYADKVAKVKSKTSELVDKVASNRPDADTPPEAPEGPVNPVAPKE